MYGGRYRYSCEILEAEPTKARMWLNDTLEVKYSFQSLNYDERIGFNGSVSAIFPVLPSSDIKVFAFTQEEGILSGPAEADITITYYY